MEGSDGPTYVVVVPVKPPATGKSRLDGVPGVDRRVLAEAFAIDTVTACLATPAVAGVVVVTEDQELAATCTALGALTCPDGPVPGLNPALITGAGFARRRWPTATPVALLADLPALTPADLSAALSVLDGRSGSSYVVDAEGTGTTLYSAAYDDFAPRFGPGSAAAHAATGAVAIPGPLDSLRRDVDDAVSLEIAKVLHVGDATAAALARL